MTKDFNRMLVDLGLTEDQVSSAAAIIEDRVPMPPDDYKFIYTNSPIHGMGVFACAAYAQNEVVGACRLGLSRTPLGYMVNHSDTPNIESVPMEDGSGYMRTLRPISEGEELLVDYRHAVSQAAKAEYTIVASQGVQDTFNSLVKLAESGASREELRVAIDGVEQELLKMPQADHGLDHMFTDGLYIRLARIFPMTLFTTPIYREECILTLLRGRIIVITEDGITAVAAPAWTLTKPALKRVIFALDDVLAHTVHPNPDNEHDIEKLEARIYAASYKDLAIEGSLL